MSRSLEFRAIFDNEVVEYVEWRECNWRYSVDQVHWYFERQFAHTKLQQFTGLFDKNGKKIYEGDTVRYKIGAIKTGGRVSWGPGDARWLKDGQALSTYQKTTEVI